MKHGAIGFVVGMALLTASLPAGALGQSANWTADIRDGTCLKPGSVIAQLQGPAVASGQRQGAKNAIGAATSFTPAPATLTDLLGSDHVVALSSDDRILACGAIGGSLETDGSLGIVLRPQTSGGPDGVAYFAATGDVSLFIDPGELARTGMGIVPTATPEAAQPAAVTPVVAVTPSADVASTSQATGFSADEQAYLSEVGPLLTNMGSSFGRVSTLLQSPQIGDADWSIQLATELALWKATYQKVNSITPPPAFAEMHATVVEALRLDDAAATDMANALDTLDPNLLLQAKSEMDQSNALIQQANDQLNQLKSERGQ